MNVSQRLHQSLVPVVFFIGSASLAYGIIWITSVSFAVDGTPSSIERDGVVLLDPQYPCGPVCVSIVCGLNGKPHSLQEVRSLVTPDRLGRTTLGELVSACETLGLSAVGMRIDQQSLSRLKVPVIVHTRENHFVVSIADSSGKVLILDPPRRPQEKTTAELRSYCTGNVILVAKDRSELRQAMREGGVRDTGNVE